MTQSIPVSGSANNEGATERLMRIISAQHRTDLIVSSHSRPRITFSTEWDVKPGELDTAKTGPVPKCFKSCETVLSVSGNPARIAPGQSNDTNYCLLDEEAMVQIIDDLLLTCIRTARCGWSSSQALAAVMYAH
jgi:hypothetical protein